MTLEKLSDLWGQCHTLSNEQREHNSEKMVVPIYSRRAASAEVQKCRSAEVQQKFILESISGHFFWGQICTTRGHCSG
jgi:hypothetical protein